MNKPTRSGGDDPGAGLGVDTYGSAAIDPTANVIANIADVVERFTELRETDIAHAEAMLAALKERADCLRVAESARVDGVTDLHAMYGRLLATAEAKRIDDVRLVAVAAEERLARQTDNSNMELRERITVIERSQGDSVVRRGALSTAGTIAFSVCTVAVAVTAAVIGYNVSKQPNGPAAAPQVIYVPTPTPTPTPTPKESAR